MSDSFDVVVIGGGPAGYPAAIRAAQNKLSVACIDEWKNPEGNPVFGGTCLNVGCIPSKALLESSELYHRLREEFAVHGIRTSGASFDVAQMQKRKSGIVKTSTQGILALFKASRRHAAAGSRASCCLASAWSSRPTTAASASSPRSTSCSPRGPCRCELPSAPFDGKYILDSCGALDLEAVPKRLGVIGAGIIGLELGSVWRRLGSELVVLEALPDFLPTVDQQVAKEALRQFKKQGFDIRLGAKVTGAKVANDSVEVTYRDAKEEHSLTLDKLIVAIGRRPFTRDLLAPGTGVALDERGFIKVDHECRTGVEGVWAVGDCVRGPMLAHKGKEEGVTVGGSHRRPFWRGQLQDYPLGHLHRSGDRLGR